MIVVVENIDDDIVKVNGKLVIRDMNDNWILNERNVAPDFNEKVAFRAFLKASQSFPNLIKAEFKFKT